MKQFSPILAKSETYIWEDIPKIQICDKHVSESEVIESINYWQEELNLGDIEVEFNSQCRHSNNVIQISRNRDYTEDYGKTKLNFFQNQNILQIKKSNLYFVNHPKEFLLKWYSN